MAVCFDYAWILCVGLSMLSPVAFGQTGFIDDEGQLRTELFANYTKEVRPGYTANVTLAGNLASLVHLDISRESMSLIIAFDLAWFDERLSWTPASHGGLTTLVVDPTKIWTPPLVISNEISDLSLIGKANGDGVLAHVNYTGEVKWNPPRLTVTSCGMSIKKYPMDTQVCNVMLTTWTFPNVQLNLTATHIDSQSFYQEHGEFELLSTSVNPFDVFTQTSLDWSRIIRLTFTFKRRWQVYFQSLILPLLVNSILIVAVFWLPLASGEKMGYCLTVLLSYVVFLTYVTESLPPVATEISILQVYLAIVLALGCLATLLTVWVLSLYHRPEGEHVTRGYIRVAAILLAILRRRYKPAKISPNQMQPTHSSLLAKEVPNSKPFADLPGSPEMSETKSEHMVFNDRLPKEKTSIFGGKDTGRIGVSQNTAEEVSPSSLSWQEFASLLDAFFLRIFHLVLLLLTVVVFGLLFVD